MSVRYCHILFFDDIALLLLCMWDFFMYVQNGDLILHLYDFYYASHFSILAQFIMCLALSVFSLFLYFGR
jgi:hypothetical protein